MGKNGERVEYVKVSTAWARRVGEDRRFIKVKDYMIVTLVNGAGGGRGTE